MDEYDAKKYFNQAAHALQTLGKSHPNAMKGFQEFMGNVKKDGVLSRKVKELIGIALSIVKRCKFCVAWHVKYALEAGATREEIIEASIQREIRKTSRRRIPRTAEKAQRKRSNRNI